MGKKVVVLVGSPRKNGNTAMLAEAFIKGAKSAGNEVDVISAADYKVSGCLGCDACKRSETHKCVQRDDMEGLYERLSAAEAIVIATPIYFYGVSAQLKCVIDRLHNPIRSGFKVKKLAFLGVCADTIPSVYDSVTAMYRSVLSYFSLEDGGMVTVYGVSARGDIKDNPKLLDAEKMGTQI